MRRILLALAFLVAALPIRAHAGGWPTLVEYQRALRAGGASILHDPALKAGTLKRNTMGPVILPGGTAGVISVTDANQQQWAIRFFTAKPPHDRHEAIARAIQQSGLGEGGKGLFPHFEYHAQGIQVGGKWFPVLKMAWVSGKKLNQHVDSVLAEGKHAELDAMAEDFREMHAAMRAKNMAHGDLQHGNVLVVANKKMKFIDPDDVFAEEFRGQESGGEGHHAYKHPTRDEQEFGLDIDNFSALVVYTSLKALAHDPGMWDDDKIHIAAKGGSRAGDNLIFREADFEQPDGKAVFARLAKSPSKEVRRLGDVIAKLCTVHASQVPPLEEVLSGKIIERPAKVRAGVTPKSHAAAEPEEAEAEEESAPFVDVPGPAMVIEPGPNSTAGEWAAHRLRLLKRR